MFHVSPSSFRRLGPVVRRLSLTSERDCQFDSEGYVSESSKKFEIIYSDSSCLREADCFLQSPCVNESFFAKAVQLFTIAVGVSSEMHHQNG